MKSKYLSISILIALLSVGVQVGYASFQPSFATLTSGGTTTWYDLNAATTNADFSSANLGSFDFTTDQLTLGAQLNVTGGNVEYARIGWAIRNTDTQTLVAPFDEVNGAFQSMDNNNDRWIIPTASSPNVLAGLTAGGNYQLEVYLHGKYNGGGEFFANNGGNNYVAAFTAVPEPASFALGLGLVGMTTLALRRRRHNS